MNNKYKFKVGDRVEYLDSYDRKLIGTISHRYSEKTNSGKLVRYYKIGGLPRSEKRIVAKFITRG